MPRLKNITPDLQPTRLPRACWGSVWEIQQSGEQEATASESTRKQNPKRLRSTKNQSEAQKSNESKSARVNGKEVSKLCQEKFLIDGRYRFVYDLFKTVKELRSPRFDDEDLPIPERFLIFFEEYHKEAVKRYIRDQRGNFSNIIKEYAGEAVDMEAFHTCLKKFEEYKPDDYSETGFVCYCSAIAYLGNHFVEKGNLKAWENTFMYVFALLCDVLDKSKFQCDLAESSW